MSYREIVGNESDIPVKNNIQRVSAIVRKYPKHPKDFNYFAQEIFMVIRGESDLTKLKQYNKSLQDTFVSWMDFADKNNYFALHSFLIDIYSTREPLLRYIQTIRNTPTKKQIQEIRRLWESCKHTYHTVKSCHAIQTELVAILQNQEQYHDGAKKQTKKEASSSLGKVLGFKDSQEEDNRDEFRDIVDKVYTTTNQGVPVPKSAFDDILTKIQRDDDFME